MNFLMSAIINQVLLINNLRHKEVFFMSNQNINSNNVTSAVFTREEAVKIIIAGIENQAIRFPFTNAIELDDVNKTVSCILQSRDGRFNNRVTEERLRDADTYAIGHALQDLARKDALYLLAMLNTLTTPLSDNELKQLMYWREHI